MKLKRGEESRRSPEREKEGEYGEGLVVVLLGRERKRGLVLHQTIYGGEGVSVSP